MEKTIKTYKGVYNPAKNTGVYGISLVRNPAMEGIAIALAEAQVEVKFATVDTEQRILMGLVMEPDKPIYRNQDGHEFYVTFDADTVKELAHGFFRGGFHKNSSIEHDDASRIEGVTFVESWLVSDPEKDKSANFGFSYPVGSWMATMKIDNDQVWENYVKTGKVQGFSIDAMVSLEEVPNENNKFNFSMSTIKDAIKELLIELGIAKKPEGDEVIGQTDVKLGAIKTEDGKITIEYDGEAMAVGGNVWVTADDQTKVPVPVGEHKLEDGTVLVVTEEGIIAEVKAVEVAEESAPADLSDPVTTAPTAQDVRDLTSAAKSILVKYTEATAKLDEVTTKLADTEARLAKAETTIIEMGEAPAAKPVRQAPAAAAPTTKKGRILDAIQNANSN